jgi:DNA modification methylase
MSKLPINQIIQGDCLEVIKNIKFDIIITDPPYNQNYHYKSYNDSLSEKSYLKLLSCIRKPAVVIHYPEQTINLLPKILGKCSEVVSWTYSTRTKKHHRLITWWGCQPDFCKVKEPYAKATLKDKRNQHKIKDGRCLKDVWQIPYVNNMNKEKTAHPCQIPEEVIRRIILTTTKEGDIILDPFAGSGTTGKVAKDLNRESILIEKDAYYCEIIKKRLKQVQQRLL